MHRGEMTKVTLYPIRPLPTHARTFTAVGSSKYQRFSDCTRIVTARVLIPTWPGLRFACKLELRIANGGRKQARRPHYRAHPKHVREPVLRLKLQGSEMWLSLNLLMDLYYDLFLFCPSILGTHISYNHLK